ncbi:hypothetical protein DV515_00013828 [Chloebia gouldiae]|uniref:Sperm-associated antigen 5 n=1 Tax=Chloebia gouldiae TaxID=44316 RepID=A0A3L8S197_CHLGU|nr:hypothetical protein DV515_00013828 [Chloebia gouldiae]
MREELSPPARLSVRPSAGRGAAGAWPTAGATPTQPRITGRGPAPQRSVRAVTRAAQPLRAASAFQTGGGNRGQTGPAPAGTSARPRPGPSREPAPDRDRPRPGTRARPDRPQPGTSARPRPAPAGNQRQAETGPNREPGLRRGQSPGPDREPRPTPARWIRSRARERGREHRRAMQRAETLAAQKRPRRTPLQQLQSEADHTGLSPLFRRLRLKDHDCATPVSCARGPRSSVTTAPCTPGRRRTATLGPLSSTTLVPGILEPSSRTSTCDLRTPILKPGAFEAPRNATLISGALEPPSSTVPAPVSIPVSTISETPSSTVPAPVCSSIPMPSITEPPSIMMPAPVCSSIPMPSMSEPPSSPVPAPVCSSIPVPSVTEPPSSPVPAPVCSSIPVPRITEPPSIMMPAPVCSSIPVPSISETPSTPVPAPVCSSIPVPSITEPPSTPVPAPVCSSIPVPRMMPVPTRAIGTSMSPVPTMATGTSVTPVLSMATGTFMTPQDMGERSISTSEGSLPCAKGSAVETGSLLCHCPREQLKTLPRAELEERLESALIIIKALSLQLCDWQDNQRLRPGVGLPKQRDTFTQTDTTHPEGSTWSSQSLLFRGLADAAFRSLQDEQGALVQEREQKRTLVSQRQAVLETAPRKVQSCLEERGAIRQQVDEALRAQDQGYLFLEAFCAHASTQISARDQCLASQQELSTLLAHAINLKASLSAETQSFREFLDVTFENLEKERRAVDEEREQTRALMSQSFALLEHVHGKLQSCLEERAAAQKREEEALQAKEKTSMQLEKTLVTLQDTQAQLEELTAANSVLGKDLSSMGINLSTVEQERDALQQENEKQREEMAQLVQERNSLQQECKELCQELREATECREFLDQENQMCHTQLLEVEARLNSTLATLQERVQQHEKLMESHQHLREEQAALSKELDSTKTELLSLQAKRIKVTCCFTDIMKSKMLLQGLADCLKAVLEEQDDDDAPSRSKARTPHLAWTPACCTPHHTGSSFVGSVLKAVSGKDVNETPRSGSRVAKDKLASVPKPIDPEDTLLESVKELRAVVSNFTILSFRIQELKTKISDLQLRLEAVTAESQEKVDDQAATIAELHKALRTKAEHEKELQDVVKQQEEQMFQLIDKSGEVTRLKTEVFELKRLLQRAETEAKVLWEEVKGKEHQVNTVHIQERIMLQRELLSAVPEVALSCQELQNLLRYVGLKPASKEAAEPL